MKCELCDCRFSTKEDMMWHLRAHEMYGDDEFPGMGKTKKWTIKKMINKYGVFLQTEGRTVEQKTMHIIYDKNEKPDYSYSDPEYLKIREKKIKDAFGRCEICKSKNDIQCHHIIPVVSNVDGFLDPKNIIVLCKQCHQEVHSGYSRMRYNYECDNSDFVWVDYEAEEIHDCVQCGSAFYGPLYRKFCKTCYQRNNNNYY